VVVGGGLEVRGTAHNVLLLLGGRTALLDDGTGPGGAQLRARLRNHLATGHERNFPMPTFHIPPTLDMHYKVGDYTDP